MQHSIWDAFTADNHALTRGLLGAIAGAVAGYVAFVWAVQQHGVVLFALPGALTGLGRSLAARHKSLALAIVCAALGLAIPVYIAETILGGGVLALSAVSQLAVLASGAIGFYLGYGKLWGLGRLPIP